MGLIDVEERHRQDLGDINELAKSVELNGILQPIGVEEKPNGRFKLLYGGRRLAAHLVLKRTEIEALVRGEMTEVEAQLLELEENLRRKQLTWQEEQDAIDKIHKLKMATDKTWSTEKTAALIGKSRRTVFNALELSQAVKSIPDVAAADKPLAAMNRLKRHKQFAQRKEEVQLRRLANEQKPDEDKGPNLFWHVYNEDCVTHMKDMSDGCVDMILTDPPWAVDYDQLLIGEVKSFDDSQNILPTVQAAIRECFRILRDQRFCVMYWPSNATPIPAVLVEKMGAPQGITLHELGRWFLTSAGFRVWPRPIIWYKPNKHFGSVSDPSRQFPSQYETILWAFKGEARFFKNPGSDLFVAETPAAKDKQHPNEKNRELSEIFIDICTVEDEIVCDPFAGGGVHGEAALYQGRSCHLVELDREFADRATVRCEHTSQRIISGELQVASSKQPGADERASQGANGQSSNTVILPNPNRANIAPSAIEKFPDVIGLDDELFDPDPEWQ